MSSEYPEIANGLIVTGSGITYPGFDEKLPCNRPAPEKEIEACKHWLSEWAVKTKTVRRANSSYLYKHYVERWYANEPCPQFPGHVYVCNGAFIIAALRNRYTIVPCERGSLNAYLNLSLDRESRRFHEDWQ